MAIDWVISEGRLSLLHTLENGERSPLIEFEAEVNDLEDARRVVSARKEEILKVCAQHGIDPSKISGL